MSVTAAHDPKATRHMKLHSEILGPLTVSDEAVIRFPAGLFGFPDCQSFVLLPANREGTYWLQSVDRAELAFVLVDPFLFFPDYAADIGPGDLAEVEATDGAEVAVLAIVTLPGTRAERPTANLQGPLALSLKSRLGKQLALQDPTHGVRCEFDLARSGG